MRRRSDALARFLAFGVLGWAIENALFAPRYSRLFGGARVPFLPIYGVGGVLATELSRRVLRDGGVPLRLLTYGVSLTVLEAVAGSTERALGRESWSYDGKVVDARHAAAWAALGLVAEEIDRRWLDHQ